MKRQLQKITALLFLTVALLVSPALAQSPSPVAPAGEAVHSKTLWETIREGGWVMFPIAICSIATLYLIGDGVIRTQPAKVAPPEHEQRIKELFRNGDYV